MTTCSHQGGLLNHVYNTDILCEFEKLGIVFAGRHITRLADNNIYIRMVKMSVDNGSLIRVGDRTYRVDPFWTVERINACVARQREDVGQHRFEIEKGCLTELYDLIIPPMCRFLATTTDRLITIDCHDRMLAVYESQDRAADFILNTCSVDVTSSIYAVVMLQFRNPGGFFRELRQMSARDFRTRYLSQGYATNDLREIQRQLDILEWSYDD